MATTANCFQHSGGKSEALMTIFKKKLLTKMHGGWLYRIHGKWQWIGHSGVIWKRKEGHWKLHKDFGPQA